MMVNTISLSAVLKIALARELVIALKYKCAFLSHEGEPAHSRVRNLCSPESVRSGTPPQRESGKQPHFLDDIACMWTLQYQGCRHNFGKRFPGCA